MAYYIIMKGEMGGEGLQGLQVGEVEYCKIMDVWGDGGSRACENDRTGRRHCMGL